MAIDDAIGSDLPAMSAEQEAAFAAEEAAAKTARTDAAGTGHTRLVQEPDHDGGGDPAAQPAPAPAAPAASPAPAAPAASPTPPAAAAPAAQPAGEDDVEGAVSATDGNRYVPVATHVQQRKALQGQLKDMQTALERANSANETLMQALQRGGQPTPVPAAAPAAAEPPPQNPHNPETHPLEHERWERQQLQKQVDELVATGNATREQAEQARAVSEAQGTYISAHRKFVAANPEFDGAYKWLTTTWAKMQQRLGYSPEQAVNMANQTEWNIVQAAIKANQHPSQVIWDMAKDAGYVPPAAPPPAAGGGAPAAAAPTPAAAIELAKAGAAAAISLSDASGGSAPQPLTLATAAKMSKEEFANLSDEQFLKLARPQRSASAA